MVNSHVNYHSHTVHSMYMMPVVDLLTFRYYNSCWNTSNSSTSVAMVTAVVVATSMVRACMGRSSDCVELLNFRQNDRPEVLGMQLMVEMVQNQI